MGRAFGTTPHSEIVKAFEAENRQHTFVEQLSSGEYTKKYQLRLSQEELLTLLDSLYRDAGEVSVAARSEKRILGTELGAHGAMLAVRQLRAKILATLGLFEEG